MSTVSVRHQQLFIDGTHVDSDEYYEIISPATEEVVFTAAKGSREHADRAIAAARRSFEAGSWSRRAPEERAAVMRRIGERMTEEFDDLVELEMIANGCTMRQALGFHVGMAAPHWLHFADLAGTYEYETAIVKPPYPTYSLNTIRREPIGVCAAIVPWNGPLVLAIWKVAPALAAGNSIVVKVDEKTPMSLIRVAEIAHDCGLPAGVFNVITGDGPEVGAHLAAHPDVDKIAFTGSTAVGREVMRAASDTVKKVTLELGGKGPVILLDDAPLDSAIDGALFGCMLYSGQICASGTRLLVPEALHDEVVARLVERASTIKLGDPMDLDTDMGPLISAQQRERVLGYLDIARADGAEIVLGGGVPEGPEFEKGFWVQPTIITEVTNEQTIAREEIFGPVLAVLRYRDVEEAIAIANDTHYGLAAGVWSSDYERATEVGHRLRAGTVWINNWHQFHPSLPFGGYKQSGTGRELGPRALDEYTEEKHLHVDLTTERERHIFDLLLSTPPQHEAAS